MKKNKWELYTPGDGWINLTQIKKNNRKSLGIHKIHGVWSDIHNISKPRESSQYKKIEDFCLEKIRKHKYLYRQLIHLVLVENSSFAREWLRKL